MKKIKLLPLLCVAPFALTGCNKVNKPHFAKVGDKVSAEKFVEAFDEKIEKNGFLTAEKLSSYVLKEVNKTSDESIVKRGKKTIAKSKLYFNTKSTTKVDTKNNVIEITENVKGVSKRKDAEGKTRSVYRAKEDTFYQQESKDGVKYLAEVNAKKKEYSLDTELSDNLTISDAITRVGGLKLLYIFMGAYQYIENYSANEDATCYQNKDVFTIEIKSEDTYSEYGVSEDDVIFTSKFKDYGKFQIQFLKNDGIKIVTYSEWTEETEYKQPYEFEDQEGNEYEVTKGDSAKYVSKESRVIELKKKDVKVKAKKTGKFALVEGNGKY